MVLILLSILGGYFIQVNIQKSYSSLYCLSISATESVYMIFQHYQAQECNSQLPQSQKWFNQCFNLPSFVLTQLTKHAKLITKLPLKKYQKGNQMKWARECIKTDFSTISCHHQMCYSQWIRWIKKRMGRTPISLDERVTNAELMQCFGCNQTCIIFKIYL